jgi:hypothetical protein
VLWGYAVVASCLLASSAPIHFLRGFGSKVEQTFDIGYLQYPLALPPANVTSMFDLAAYRHVLIWCITEAQKLKTAFATFWQILTGIVFNCLHNYINVLSAVLVLYNK